MKKSKRALEYSLVRFAPFPETGEFANVGVVLADPDTGYFDYRLLAKKYARVTRFFEPIDRSLYTVAVRRVRDELMRIRQLCNRIGENQLTFDFGEGAAVRMLIKDMTRKREGTMVFSEPKVVLTDDPPNTLDRLYRFYVDRDFANPVYRERMLEKEVRELLKASDLIGQFRSQRLTDGDYSVLFPFVRSDSSEIQKVIKPFYLGQSKAEAIIDHGVSWRYRVERLKKAQVLPESILFPVEKPQDGDRRLRAFSDVMDMLGDVGVQVVEASNRERILDFARTR